ncbi:MAG: hypothetical protein ACXW29_10000, partial [Thermoanaerobaculia bacterium]
MRYGIGIAIVALALAVSPGFAQNKPEELQKLVENIDVRVINIDVVVTDRSGNPVTGLKREDFEIFENNIPKPISNFYEVEGSMPKNVEGEGQIIDTPSAPVAAVRADDIPDNMRRRIIFYIDNLSLAPFNRNRVFKEMKAFLKT